ncbi:hypothetical protein [Archangium sp.]|uniref:hypothetical protein n=1 Tax=Archangium sp. TaxID=1872627 RepID=UPI0038999CF1
MPTPQQLLCAALAAGCIVCTTPAEARFGKSGGSGSSGSGSSGGGGSRGSGGPGGSSSGGSHGSGHGGGWSPHEHGGGGGHERVHDATPVGQESDGHDGHGGSHGGGGGPPDRGPRRAILFLGHAWLWHHENEYYRRHGPYPVATQEPEPDEPSHPVMVRLGAEGQRLRDGGAWGFNLGIEERRWGVSTRFTALALLADDGSDGVDHLQLMEAHVTFAPLVSEFGRLRFEGGVAAARAPDVTFVGPSLAASFERCLVGALDLEGRVQWVPIPHLQLDGQAGLAVHLGVLTLRAGWRGLLLDDRGLVDGEVHRDVLGGPFGGLGLNF